MLIPYLHFHPFNLPFLLYLNKLYIYKKLHAPNSKTLGNINEKRKKFKEMFGKNNYENNGF